MQLETFSYDGKKWSVDSFPNLDSDSTLVVVFGAPLFVSTPAHLKDLAAHYQNSIVLGCTATGEVLGDLIFDNRLSVGIVKFEATHLYYADTAADVPEFNPAWATQVARQLDQPHLRGVLALAEGIHVSREDLVRAFHAALPDTVAVAGGLVGEGAAFQRTWPIRAKGGGQGRRVAGVGFYGESVRGTGEDMGSVIFGPELAAGLLFPLVVRSIKAGDKKDVLGTTASTQAIEQMLSGDEAQGYLSELLDKRDGN